MRSKLMMGLQLQCLTFWYHMYGADMGSLTVSTETTSGGTKTLWSKATNQGTNWLRADVQLDERSNYFVLFTG